MSLSGRPLRPPSLKLITQESIRLLGLFGHAEVRL